MDASASALNADDRANELYWGSDMSVNQIADALDLSKGALYELIRPLAADVTCPSCGAEAVHPNRTAKEKGLIACPDCGWGGEEGANGRADRATPTPSRAAGAEEEGAERAGRPVDRRRSALAGGILLGAAAGVALVLWSRRK
jgi:predicted RNA-binding Zn-ribbon protein involved in translation (DUF1610 family)